MCGIVGGKNLKSIDEFLDFAWNRLKIRGEDGFGVVFFDNNLNYFICKDIKKENVLIFLRKNSEKIKNFPFFLAHNRKASLGSLINYELTHPIMYKNIILIHNGTKLLLKQLFDMESDTLAIAYLLNELKLNDNKKFIEKILDKAGIIFGFKKEEKLFFFQKDKTRSLYFSQKNLIFSSLPLFEDMKKVEEFSFKIKKFFEDIFFDFQIINENKEKKEENINEEIFFFNFTKTWKA